MFFACTGFDDECKYWLEEATTWVGLFRPEPNGAPIFSTRQIDKAKEIFKTLRIKSQEMRKENQHKHA